MSRSPLVSSLLAGPEYLFAQTPAGGSRHMDGERFLISMKWQQTSGTAEQKVPFEIICLIEALEKGTYERAYLVLGGEGWKPKLKSLYTSGGLEKYLPKADHVEILGLETFIAKANQGNL